MVFRILTSRHFTYPKIEGSKNPKHRPHTQYVMEMRNYIVGIMQRNIYTPVCLNNSSQSSNCELYLKSLSKQHWSCEPQRPAVKGPKPTENFNTSRNCNNHCSTCKVGSCIHVLPNGVHVMSPYLEPLYGNSSHCVYHSYISKYRFSSKKTLHVTHNAECRLNQHVYLWVLLVLRI